jgi:predicted ATPase/DNA-binding SARP family transcriptional activator
VELRLLGSFSVSIDGAVVAADAWRLGKAKDVVKLLALAPHHRLHRDQLIDVLWPDRDPRSGANNLYQALSAARRAITSAGGDGHACIRLEDEWLTLCPTTPLWIDVDAFEDVSSSNDVEDLLEALALYRGELLADDRYIDWAASRREAVRQRYHAILIALGRQCEQAGDLLEAQSLFRRLLDDDPANEVAHQALMRVAARSGDRVAAIRQYELLEEALQLELDVRPGDESRKLLDDIRSGKFEPVASAGPAHNLPVPLSTFVGREREMVDLPPLVGRSRLVTLTGSGGCGKTRLATEVAGRCLDEFDDGVFLVGLGPLTDPSLVDLELARTLGVRAVEGERALDAVARRIGGRRMLLVLDNCEHLIKAAAAGAEASLATCPRLVVLATSREPLRVPGEIVHRVPSLELPNPAHLPSAAELTHYAAVRLLVDRVAAVDPTFTINESNAAAVATLCFRLDGLPLALELAAARVPALSIAGVADRLDDRFHLLTGGQRTALTRHQTLQGTVEWSFDLLPEEQQTLFCRLAVFRGGFDAEDADAVGGGRDEESGGVAPQLADLVDRSMVVAEADGEHVRFRLLETMREYGTARLRAENRLSEVRHSHARWFAALVEHASNEFTGPDRHRWMARLDDSREDLREALAYLETTNPGLAVRMASSLWPYWLWFGYLDDGLRQLEAALAADTGPSEERSECWLGAFAIHTRWSGMKSPGLHSYTANALAEAREVRSSAAESRALVFDGIYWYIADLDHLDVADERFRCAQQIAHVGGLLIEEASALHARAVLAWYRQHLDLSRQLLHEALDLVPTQPDRAGSMLMFAIGAVVTSLRLGEPWLVWEETLLPYRATAGRCGVAYALASMGNLERAAGRMVEAGQYLREASAIYDDEGDQAGEALTQSRLGRLALALGDLDEAQARLERALAIHERIGDARAFHFDRLALGRAAIESGCLDVARRMLSDVERTVRARGDLPALGASLSARGVLEIAEGLPESAVATFTERLEVQKSLAHNLTLAVAAHDLADAHLRAGDTVAATAQAAEGLAVFEALGYQAAADRCRHILAGD